MAHRNRITIAQLRAAEGLIQRAEVMGRPIPEDVLERARLILRIAEEDGLAQTASQNPIGNPA